LRRRRMPWSANKHVYEITNNSTTTLQRQL
jgi:hypothetical protein